MSTRTDIRNAFTVDVEDYFQVSALAPYIERSRWDSIECRVERNVERILALLADSGNRATFFTLGWIAERHPDMVRRIAAAGHEIASHGTAHLRATEQSPAEFLDDILVTGGKRGRVPEYWDGNAAKRIAADLHDWLLQRSTH